MSPRRSPSGSRSRARCEARLIEGASALGQNLDDAVRTRLLDYLEALEAWNATHNLTAVRDPQAMVTRHLLDCLAIAAYIDGQRLADVGSGAGLPGLVLACLWPDRAVTLVESNRKKVAFLRHARRVLGLANVEVVSARVEAYAPTNDFDWVLTRAFASAADTVHHAGHLVGPGTRLGLMKARETDQELVALTGAMAETPADLGWQRVAEHRLDVPGLDEARVLLVLARENASA